LNVEAPTFTAGPVLGVDRLERMPLSIRSAAPERGEHTDVILRELEYTDAEIDALRRAEAI